MNENNDENLQTSSNVLETNTVKKEKKKFTLNNLIKAPLILIYLLKYICLGTYYTLYYVILKPLSYISSWLQNAYYALFTSRRVKKEKELVLNINYDEKGGITESKEIMAPQTTIKTEKKMPKIPQSLLKKREILLKELSSGSEERYDKPQTFRYAALNPDKKLVYSTFVGVSRLDIYTFLTGEGYIVYSIETSKFINFVNGDSLSFGGKLSNKNLIFFLTQLGTYIRAGITLTEAMRIISKQLSKDKKQHRIMQSIVYYLTMGESFSNALLKQGKAFPQMAINMIKASEAAGNLDEALKDLENYYTEINATKKQMISALTYPAFVAGFSLIIVVVIMLKVIPKFVGIYESAGADLNALTKFIIWLSNFLQKNILLIFGIIALIIVILVLMYKKIKAFRRAVQQLMMKIPVFGKIIIYNELTIFTKTFASLLKNDVFITDSIDILSKLTNNEIYKEIMYNTIANITKGEKISESFRDHWAIPDVAYYMIVTGENTGSLAEMMARVSNFYQEQHASMINSMKSLIEPLMIISLALIVGGIMIAVILPMFQLYGKIM